jgi:transposase
MGMRPPVFVRAITDEERRALEAGLRSSEAFVMRRCQILLASERGGRVPQIVQMLGCADQTALNVIHAFNNRGLASLTPLSRRPKTVHTAFDEEGAEKLRQILHQSPRDFDKPTSVWTLELAVEVSFEKELTKERVSMETIRSTLGRLGMSWQRAKNWIISPDPQYERKKAQRLVDRIGCSSPGVGIGL